MSIELQNICKCFREQHVFQNLSCTFKDEHVNCITGPSGCGKTTLLRLLMGFLQPDSGIIYGLNDRRMTAVFQEDRLFSHLSPYDNVRVVLKQRNSRAKILSALEAVGLKESATKPVGILSGGMKRRTAIVRALLADGDLLLMDEPFRGLDTETRAHVIHFVREHLAKRTAIIVTHDPEETSLLNGIQLDLKKLHVLNR